MGKRRYKELVSHDPVCRDVPLINIARAFRFETVLSFDDKSWLSSLISGDASNAFDKPICGAVRRAIRKLDGDSAKSQTGPISLAGRPRLERDVGPCCDFLEQRLVDRKHDMTVWVLEKEKKVEWAGGKWCQKPVEGCPSGAE